MNRPRNEINAASWTRPLDAVATALGPAPSDDDANRRAALEAGVRDYLKKNLSIEVTCDRLQNGGSSDPRVVVKLVLEGETISEGSDTFDY